MERDLLKLVALGHPQRLATFRLLVRRYPDRVPAGEIAQALDLKASTLSVHLGALRQAGLIEQERQGTSLRYRAEMEGARALVAFLVGDCCHGRADLCPPLMTPHHGSGPMTQKRYNVLFICTGNSARSIIAESILRRDAGDRFIAHSAGTRPYSELNPVAVELLRGKGHNIAPLRAKHVREFQGEDAPRMDFVFTVCDRAANEDCPSWPGQPITGHWGMPDPVKAEGTEAQKHLAFQQTYGVLRNRLSAFAALPIASLDRTTLQRRVDRLAERDEATA